MLLVVDEDDDTREMIQLALEDEGFEVSVASDGDEAIGILEHKRPALVLVDLRLPHMTGWQLVHQIKEDPELADIPVCVMTDEPELAKIEEVHIVLRPVGIERLVELVRDELAR